MKTILETTAIDLWQALDAKIVMLPGATCMFSGLPSPSFNRMIVREAASVEAFVDALEVAKRFKLPYSVLIPNGCSLSVKKRFVLQHEMTSMCLDVANVCVMKEESHVTICHVSTPCEVKKTLEIWQESFTVDPVTHALHVERVVGLFEKGDLPFRFYLGYLDAMPVSCGWLLLGKEYASIYNIGTRRFARKKGAATQMMQRLIADAKREGYDKVLLTALPEAKSIYERLGFRAVTGHGVYLPSTL